MKTKFFNGKHWRTLWVSINLYTLILLHFFNDKYNYVHVNIEYKNVQYYLLYIWHEKLLKYLIPFYFCLVTIVFIFLWVTMTTVNTVKVVIIIDMMTVSPFISFVNSNLMTILRLRILRSMTKRRALNITWGGESQMIFLFFNKLWKSLYLFVWYCFFGLSIIKRLNQWLPPSFVFSKWIFWSRYNRWQEWSTVVLLVWV